jgi:hypothetical protein
VKEEDKWLAMKSISFSVFRAPCLLEAGALPGFDDMKRSTDDKWR